MPAMIEYIQKDSFFHRLHPITKILWTFGVLIISFLFSTPLPIFIILLSNILIAVASGIFKQVFPAIKALFLFSLLLIVFQIFFVTEGNTLFYAIPFTNIGRVTDVGLNLSLVMSFRMVATVSTIPILMMTTPMTDMVVVLVEKLKIPFKFAFMFITALRFIPTLLGEIEQIMQAQMSRGYNSDTRNPFKKIIIIIPLAIPLLVSSIKKTEKMAISMEARGFASGPRSYYKKIMMKKEDYASLFVLISVIFITAIVF
ncbi:MAG TPA: energy-coupling factor transporter transmembrane component T [Pseudobacteroides sp.]|nr:energy-coupling factor transporter transmembrane component T [Pseudobacteroides sp.]